MLSAIDRYLLLSRSWDDKPEIRSSFLQMVECFQTILTNWQHHSNTLKKQLDREVRWSYDIDELENSLDVTGSMALHVGSIGLMSQNTGSTSTKYKPTSTSSELTRRLDEKSQSIDENLEREINPQGYLAFDPTTDKQEVSDDSQNSQGGYELSSKALKERETNNVPVFEMFYKTTSQTSQTKLLPSPRTSRPSLQHRSFELSNESQRSGGYESSVPNTPSDSESRKLLPTDYSLPVTTTKSHGGGRSSVQTRSVDSRTPSASSSVVTTITHVESPPHHAHSYFTLDPRYSDIDIMPPVFDGESDGSQNLSDEEERQRRMVPVHSVGGVEGVADPEIAYRPMDATALNRLPNDEGEHFSSQAEEETSLNTGSKEPAQCFVLDSAKGRQVK